jgi:PAS domain S-box-containing protein
VRLLPDVLFRCYKGRDGKIYWSLNEGGLAEEFHLTTEEIRGKSLEQLFPGGASDAMKEHFEAAFRGEPTVFTNEIAGRHFRHFPQPVRDSDGNIVEVVGFIAEVTQLVEAERELRAANRELEAFAHTVSHDMLGPLSATRNLLFLLRGRLDGDARELVERVEGIVARMSASTESLLRLAQAGRRAPQRVDIDVTEAARDVIADLAATEPQRMIVWDVDDGMQVEGDREWVRLALANLLGNAMKYTRATAAPRVGVRIEQRDGRAWILVEDNGAGILAADAATVWQPFARLATDQPGYGIGLATVKRIVDAHRGDVVAEPRQGGGACFGFTLEPVRLPPEPSTAAAPVRLPRPPRPAPTERRAGP